MAQPPFHAFAYTGEARQPAVLANATIFFIVTPLIAAIRLYARISSGVGLWWDDWLSFAALVCAVAFNAIIVFFIKCGLGAWPTPLIFGNLESFFEGFYAEELLYTVGLGLIKMSILLLYQRVFPTREMTIIVWILSFMVIGWVLGTGIAAVFQCNPVAGFWDKSLHPKCMEVSIYVKGQAIASIITDALIFLAPIRSVFQLQMPIGRKIAISGIFLLGLFAVACSIIRLPYALSSPHSTQPEYRLYNFAPGCIWTNSEFNISLICSCLPTIRPVLSRLSTKVFGTSRATRGIATYRSSGYRQTTSGTSVSGKPKDPEGNSRLLDRNNPFASDGKANATARHNTRDDSSDDVELGDLTYPQRAKNTGGIDKHGISMRRDVEVYTE